MSWFKRQKVISLTVALTLLIQQSGFAQSVDLSQVVSQMMPGRFMQESYRPVHLRGLGLDESTGSFNVLIDKGSPRPVQGTGPTAVSTSKLITYFLTGLTLPNDVFWVNLRPDGEDNIIDPRLEDTDIGRIMLEADLTLKKETARYLSPQTSEGKVFWDKLYAQAARIFGSDSSAITIPTMVRPWIVPDEIILRESGTDAYIYKATLSVKLEQDHLKNGGAYSFPDPRMKELNEYAAGLAREIIIPRLIKNVNSTKPYAQLRQVYYSLILAQWFKENYRGADSSYAGLIDSEDLTGLQSGETWSKTSYFESYKRSFNEGEYTSVAPAGLNETSRTYISGGVAFNTNGAGNPLAPTVVVHAEQTFALTRNYLESRSPGKGQQETMPADSDRQDSTSAASAVISKSTAGSADTRPKSSGTIETFARRARLWFARHELDTLYRILGWDMFRTLRSMRYLQDLKTGGITVTQKEASDPNASIWKTGWHVTLTGRNVKFDITVAGYTGWKPQAFASARGITGKYGWPDEITETELLDTLIAEAARGLLDTNGYAQYEQVISGFYGPYALFDRVALIDLLTTHQETVRNAQEFAVKSFYYNCALPNAQARALLNRNERDAYRGNLHGRIVIPGGTAESFWLETMDFPSHNIQSSPALILPQAGVETVHIPTERALAYYQALKDAQTEGALDKDRALSRGVEIVTTEAAGLADEEKFIRRIGDIVSTIFTEKNALWEQVDEKLFTRLADNTQNADRQKILRAADMIRRTRAVSHSVMTAAGHRGMDNENLIRLYAAYADFADTFPVGWEKSIPGASNKWLENVYETEKTLITKIEQFTELPQVSPEQELVVARFAERMLERGRGYFLNGARDFGFSLFTRRRLNELSWRYGTPAEKERVFIGLVASEQSVILESLKQEGTLDTAIDGLRQNGSTALADILDWSREDGHALSDFFDPTAAHAEDTRKLVAAFADFLLRQLPAQTGPRENLYLTALARVATITALWGSPMPAAQQRLLTRVRENDAPVDMPVIEALIRMQEAVDPPSVVMLLDLLDAPSVLPHADALIKMIRERIQHAYAMDKTTFLIRLIDYMEQANKDSRGYAQAKELLWLFYPSAPEAISDRLLKSTDLFMEIFSGSYLPILLRERPDLITHPAVVAGINAWAGCIPENGIMVEGELITKEGLIRALQTERRFHVPGYTQNFFDMLQDIIHQQNLSFTNTLVR